MLGSVDNNVDDDDEVATGEMATGEVKQDGVK